jgi:hypothetical protein
VLYVRVQFLEARQTVGHLRALLIEPALQRIDLLLGGRDLVFPHDPLLFGVVPLLPELLQALPWW